MVDNKIRSLIDPALDWLTKPLTRTSVTANQITVTGFVAGLVAIPAIAFNLYTVGLVCIIINRVFDGLDGIHARRTRVTELGGYLDIVLDFLFYSGIVFAFALNDSDNALAASWLILSFVGTGSSFLAYAVIAERLNISQAQIQNKTLHYLGGLTEGFETIALFVFICLFPEHFQPAAWIFGILCWITTITRILTAREHFGGQHAVEDSAEPTLHDVEENL